MSRFHLTALETIARPLELLEQAPPIFNIRYLTERLALPPTQRVLEDSRTYARAFVQGMTG